MASVTDKWAEKHWLNVPGPFYTGSARDFLAYLAGDLENDFRAYLFRLQHGRYPHTGEPLPQL